MESVWLRPGSGSAIPLDFLGPWPFCREDPVYERLYFLVFPWTLSSESRLFNGLRDIKRGKVYHPLFPWRYGGGTEIGLQISAVATPEPSTWVMMGLGFAGPGFAGWRAAKNTSTRGVSLFAAE
jgi:PEP-CTERM motif